MIETLISFFKKKLSVLKNLSKSIKASKNLLYFKRQPLLFLMRSNR